MLAGMRLCPEVMLGVRAAQGFCRPEELRFPFSFPSGKWPGKDSPRIDMWASSLQPPAQPFQNILPRSRTVGQEDSAQASVGQGYLKTTSVTITPPVLDNQDETTLSKVRSSQG